MSPSALMPWWGWVLTALASSMVAIISAMYQDERGRWFPIIVGAVAAISAWVCGVIGIVLFVKWMWSS